MYSNVASKRARNITSSPTCTAAIVPWHHLAKEDTIGTPVIQLDMAVRQNPIPLVNIKIAGKWMFISLKMVCIGVDP